MKFSEVELGKSIICSEIPSDIRQPTSTLLFQVKKLKYSENKGCVQIEHLTGIREWRPYNMDHKWVVIDTVND